MKKYLILRRRAAPEESAFEMAHPRGERDFHSPFEINSEVLDDGQVGSNRLEPNVEDVILSIPLTLIRPTAATDANTVWGIEAVGAHTSPQSGEGVTVAVLDTGIETTHAAFSGLAFDPNDLMDFTADERGVPGAAPDRDGHGTHVAGTIFGREVNGQRIGVAPGVKRALIGKILGPRGAPTEVVFNAIEWALRERADIISMSLGMDFPGVVASLVADGFPADIAASRALEAYRSNVRLFDRLAALVEARGARGRGALLVAASGNESRRNTNPLFTVATAPPAAADGFISVGAITEARSVADYSNTGCRVSAPGDGILSANRTGGLVTMNGTSMATPHVAGVMALWTQNLFPNGNRPNGWARDVQLAMENHVVPAPGQTRNDVGIGIVQAPQRPPGQLPHQVGNKGRTRSVD